MKLTSNALFLFVHPKSGCCFSAPRLLPRAVRALAGVLLVGVLWGAHPVGAQDFYKPGAVVDIKLYFSDKNWDAILDSLKQIGNDERLTGDALIGNVRYKGVGVRYKGNSSYFSVRKSGSRKLPFNIKVNHTDKNLALPGNITAIKLANGFRDPSFLREVLAYEIAGKYMPAPQANFARVFVNDEFIGLYSNTESVDKTFLQRHFDNGKGTLVKCDPADWSVKMPAGCPPSDHASLQYLGQDSVCYPAIYELEQGQWSHLIEFTQVLANNPEQLEGILDVNQTLWMLAFNNLIVNLDSYLGKFCHNYYLYRDSSGVYHPIIWDLNMAFGGFRYNGIDDAALSDEKMQALSPFLHYREKNLKRPLIVQLLSNELWRKIYVAHMRTMLEEQFLSGAFVKRAQELQRLLDPIVQKDVNKLYDYEAFRLNIDTTAKADKSNIIGLAQLMNRRAAFLAEHPLFQKEPPKVLEVKHLIQKDGLLITARTDNARRVWLFYRQGNQGLFQRVEMRDDGASGDGAPADNVWGYLLSAGKGLQYYLVAEDERNATLSPRRAAMECHVVK